MILYLHVEGIDLIYFFGSSFLHRNSLIENDNQARDTTEETTAVIGTTIGIEKEVGSVQNIVYAMVLRGQEHNLTNTPQQKIM